MVVWQSIYDYFGGVSLWIDCVQKFSKCKKCIFNWFVCGLISTLITDTWRVWLGEFLRYGLKTICGIFFMCVSSIRARYLVHTSCLLFIFFRFFIERKRTLNFFVKRGIWWLELSRGTWIRTPNPFPPFPSPHLPRSNHSTTRSSLYNMGQT